MESISRFCNAIRRPVNILVFLFLALNLCATDSVHTFFQRWRSPLVLVMMLALAVQFVNHRTRKNLSKETSHA